MKKYGVILADPPWSYNNSGINGAAANHYPTMATAEICALRVAELAAPDALLILWATWPLLYPDAGQVIDAWGFKYKTGLPWIKLQGIPTTDLFGDIVMVPAHGQGWWIRGVSEPILLCTRGDIKAAPLPPPGLISERFRHSKKPSNAHDYAERYPGPYLELFARDRRPGWDQWGNEIESDIEL